MPKPVNCRYFYGDYFRGKNHEECRLLDANPRNRHPWRRKLCDSCPVPALLQDTNCRSLALEAEVKRKFLRDRVQVTLAVCTEHVLELDDARVCPRCAERLASLTGDNNPSNE